MQIDQNPFPMHANMLELKNPKILIRPSQAKSTKGKNVVIGEERLEKKMLQNKTSRAAMKTSILGGHGNDRSDRFIERSDQSPGRSDQCPNRSERCVQ